YFSFFFFQAEDCIRDRNVTGVQTCALPIFLFLNQNVLHSLSALSLHTPSTNLQKTIKPPSHPLKHEKFLNECYFLYTTRETKNFFFRIDKLEKPEDLFLILLVD